MRRGEIWRICLDPTVGAEIRKTRPAVIVSSDALGILPLRVIVPITEWKDRYASAVWMVHIEHRNTSGLEKDSCADCFQIRSVDETRFVEQMGMVTNDELGRIIRAIGVVVDTTNPFG